ncbi:MerR family transcriptional regulator [Myxococcota bacterium]|nr:MerR family transcriptional regulator [Myxococcota bacterium]
MTEAVTTEPTYPLGITARLTGLSPELLRAWERRYAAVEPLRTPGGTRRYRARDLERLRLLKAAVVAGKRIGQIAHLDLEQLRHAAVVSDSPAPSSPIEAMLDSLVRLDAAEFQRALSLQLSTLGPRRFVDHIAAPLAREVGERWARGELSIAAEHLSTGALRSLLGSALQPSSKSLGGPQVVFATPPKEGHEMGIMMAALAAIEAGSNVTYLGPNMPVEELIQAVETVDAAALALSIVTLSPDDAEHVISQLREELPDKVALWLGGSGVGEIESRPGIEMITDLDTLEQRIALLVEQCS